MADDVASLRKLVRARQRAANNKVSRYKASGVKIAHSEHDPRRDLKAIDKYNTKQLKSYLKSLNTFVDRSTQFVKGARGVPLSRNVFKSYKGTESSYNTHFKDEFEKVRDVQMPGKGLTYGERHDTLLPKAKSLRAGTSKYFGKDRVSTGFTSDKALKTAQRHLKKSLKPGFEADVEKKRRENFASLLRFANRFDVELEVNGGITIDKDGKETKHKGLTSEEFYILWEYDSVIQNIVEEYYIVKELLSDEDDAIENSGGNALFDEILKTVKEVKSSQSLRGRLRDNNKS